MLLIFDSNKWKGMKETDKNQLPLIVVGNLGNCPMKWGKGLFYFSLDSTLHIYGASVDPTANRILQLVYDQGELNAIIDGP